VIVAVDRGQDLGRVSAVGETAATKCARCEACLTPRPPLRSTESGARLRVLRRATDTEVRAADELRVTEDEVRRTVRDRVRAFALPMKVSDAEWQWDRRKLTIYFTAEQRVDFRALVRDLAASYRTRIELRQIGAREEARRLGGIGRCGRELCIASWLPEGRPVGLSLAKAQGLSLNPAQISGPCGRLLCCLHYEHEFYVAQRNRFPKEGKLVRSPSGAERVLAVDIFRDRVTLRSDEGGVTRVIPLAQFQAELS
ncbi:MAG: PSP1 domain-containing protein, partial [Burkholderiales bacterium]